MWLSFVKYLLCQKQPISLVVDDRLFDCACFFLYGIIFNGQETDWGTLWVDINVLKAGSCKTYVMNENTFI